MAKFTVEMQIDNAAFEESSEVSRILFALAEKVLVQNIEGEIAHNLGPAVALRDVNGNTVGIAKVEED